MTQLTTGRANEIVAAMRDKTVVVFGDVMLDEFVWGDVTRISPEAPVPVVDIRRESIHLGGAANVLANLINLGASARLVGVIGQDQAGERLRAELSKTSEAGESDRLVVDSGRPTTGKTRILAHQQPGGRAARGQPT